MSPGSQLPDELAPLRAGDPESIGPFRIVGRLGQGGMGVVYGGLDGPGRCVAVKVIAGEHAADPEFRTRFAGEIALVRGLDATCAPAFLDAREQGDQLWLATEFVPGRNLRAHLTAFGPLRGAHLRAFAAGVAEGVSALHAAGVTHRDLKPGNVVLSPDGPKVLDFGIAHAHGSPGIDPNRSMGTPGWMAPERMAGAAAEPASDVFCWGLLVAFAATGTHAFGDVPSAELASRIRDAQDPDLSQLPPELAATVSAALAHDPAQRPTAESIAWSLLGGPPQASDPEGATPAVLSTALLHLLRTTWQGIDAAGHDPNAWRALGAASSVAVGAGAGAIAAQGAATATKTGLLVKGGAAVVTAGAVVAGGYFAINAIRDTPAEEEPAPAAAATETPEESPSPEAEEEPEGQEVNFRNMTARVPEEWTEVGDTDIEDSLLLDTHNPDCADPPPDREDAYWAGSTHCGHVVLYGPERINPEDDNTVWGPLNENSVPANRTDVGPCLPGMDFIDSGPQDGGPLVEDLAPIGDRDAYYREWSISCGPTPDMDIAELEGGSPPFHFRVRSWYLPESEIYIIDEWNTEGLDEVLADAEMS